MRRLSLLLPAFLAACGGSVAGPADLMGDNDDQQTGDDGGGAPDIDVPDPNQLTAKIADGTRVANAGRTITLSAVAISEPAVTYTWSFGDGVTGTGLTATHTYAAAGCYHVALRVTAPGKLGGFDSTNVFSPAPIDGDVNPLPAAHGFVPREYGTATGAFTINGTMTSPGWEAIVVDFKTGGAVESTARTELCATAAQSFALLGNIPVKLAAYDVVVRAVVGDRSEQLASTEDLVAGDVIIIQGQSNAESANYSGTTLDQSQFVRSFGSSALDQGSSVADRTWHLATGNVTTSAGSIGQWGMKMSLDLIAKNQVPLAVFNGAHGGQPISWFQRDDGNHANTATNYGRLLARLQAAGVDQHVRAVLFFQGESDGANATGHRDGFLALNADWREDYPTIEHLYVTQVRPGCGDPSLELRNYQRLFGQTIQQAHAMSSSAMDAHDGCHYQYENGYRLLGEQYARLLTRNLYGISEPDLEGIDVTTATYDAANNTVRIQLRSDASALNVEAGAAANFAVTDSAKTVTNVTVEGTTVLVVHLSVGTGAPTSVRYNGHQGNGATVLNAKGVGMLAFIVAVQ